MSAGADDVDAGHCDASHPSRDQRVRSARWFIYACLSVAPSQQNGVVILPNSTTSYLTSSFI